MSGRSALVVYVTREAPQTAVDELLVFAQDDLAPDTVRIVRELGVSDGTRYVQAALIGAAPEEWEQRWETLRPGMGKSAFVDDLVRQRVVIYATRRRDSRTELLTIEALEYPEEGLQVPAGRIDHWESLEDGLHRELAEETGITRGRIVTELPDFECSYETFSHNHAFHVVVGEETPDQWEHRVHGKGADAGLTHLCRWLPLTPALELWNARDPMLAKLRV